MAADLERLAGVFAREGRFAIAVYINSLARLARRAGAPETFNLQTLAHETPTVSEALYMQTREALAKLGFTFFVAIEAVSIGQLCTDRATRDLFDYVNPSESMRAIVPPQMEVAIDPTHVRIEKSNNLPATRQIRMILEREAALKRELPEEVKEVISMRMPNASVLAQLDLACQKQTSKPLFPDYFARTDDQTAPGRVARVGRYDPSLQLDVGGCYRDGGRDGIFAVPVVVLPRKLAA